ncbi:hypothetical protein Nepgr_012823 [Nepenthes gracilis]|uniref:Uncharacterized protein n=1 Tax=Nepenthes gracilis TaxID=150966 RepID=A0AAD3SHY7_NEPGR|nr:hypothetical protein Nepgr_012823 [Nepenthes gracilis]
MDLVCSGKSSISNLLKETMGRFKLGTQFRVSLVELKKAMSISRLVSLFPLLFFLFLFLQSSKANLSAYFFSFYGFRVIDRNLVFLVCNGILVIIVKISRTSSSENHWHNHEQISKIQDDDQPELSVTKTECLACHLGDEQLENKIEQEEEEEQQKQKMGTF